MTNHTFLSHLLVHGTSVANGIAVIEDASGECGDVSYLMTNATLLLNSTPSYSDLVSFGWYADSTHGEK